jgi:hypothetical protein
MAGTPASMSLPPVRRPRALGTRETMRMPWVTMRE